MQLTVNIILIKLFNCNKSSIIFVIDSLESNNKYYYAVDWLTIRGSCSCYGHAKQCLPGPNEDKNKPGMVSCTVIAVH